MTVPKSILAVSGSERVFRNDLEAKTVIRHTYCLHPSSRVNDGQAAANVRRVRQ